MKSADDLFTVKMVEGFEECVVRYSPLEGSDPTVFRRDEGCTSFYTLDKFQVHLRV